MTGSNHGDMSAEVCRSVGPSRTRISTRALLVRPPLFASPGAEAAQLSHRPAALPLQATPVGARPIAPQVSSGNHQPAVPLKA